MVVGFSSSNVTQPYYRGPFAAQKILQRTTLTSPTQGSTAEAFLPIHQPLTFGLLKKPLLTALMLALSVHQPARTGGESHSTKVEVYKSSVSGQNAVTETPLTPGGSIKTKKPQPTKSHPQHTLKTNKPFFTPVSLNTLITKPGGQQPPALVKLAKIPLQSIPFNIPGLDSLKAYGIYYIPQDTSLHFNDPPVLDSITAKKMRPLLKKASQMHKLARQGFFRWLFPKQSKKIQNKIEQKIIYHPKSSWKDTMPDWLKPYLVTIETDSGLKLEAYYKPPKTPKDLVWRAVHGNAGGLIDMADLVEQGGLQNADSGFFIYALPGFNHSKGPLTEEAMVESFLAGTHFLKTQNVPKSQQAIIAVSLGGAIATLAIAQESEAIEDPSENPNNRLYAFLGIVHSLTNSDDAYDGFLDATHLLKKRFSPRGHLSQTFYADAAIAKLKVPIIGFFIGDKDTFLSPTMMKSQLHTFQKTRQPDQNIIVAHSNADHSARQITTAYAHLIPHLELVIKAYNKQHKSGFDPLSN